ncbi:MAG: class A sortase [Enterococcus aquimarinus]
MKNKIKKLIAYFSLSLAFILIISGATGYLIMGSEGDPESAIKLVEKELSKSAHARQKRINQANYDEEVDFARGAEIAEAKKNYHSTIEKYGIGSIYMPKANISVPILAGTSEWNLFNGVATARANQELGEGLFIGLSHNLINDTLLKNIDQMTPGDYIYASDFEDVYTYKVIDQEVVHETNKNYFVEPAEDERGRMLVYRCEGGYGTDYRRVLYSEFVSKEPVFKTEDNILKGLNIESDAASDSDSDNEKEITDEGLELEGRDEKLSVFDRLRKKVVQSISQYDVLNNYFLTVYAQVDRQPLLFTAFVFLLFALYRFL